MATKTEKPKDTSPPTSGFRLSQAKDGTWKCVHKRTAQGSWAIGQTAGEAIENCKTGILAFEKFKVHLKRECEQPCEYCAKGTPQM